MEDKKTGCLACCGVIAIVMGIILLILAFKLGQYLFWLF